MIPQPLNIAEMLRGIGMFFRMRHYRGHGIHSPFVYTLVRRVFVDSAWVGEDRRLYDFLRANGVKMRPAFQLQNLCNLCGFEGFSTEDEEGNVLHIVMPGEGPERIYKLSRNPNLTFVVLYPYKNRERVDVCQSIASQGRRLTIDARHWFLIYNSEQLPKQHFRL